VPGGEESSTAANERVQEPLKYAPEQIKKYLGPRAEKYSYYREHKSTPPVTPYGQEWFCTHSPVAVLER